MTNIFAAIGISDADLVEARLLAAGHFSGDFATRYKKYVTQVGLALLEIYPPVRSFSPDELIDVISVIDVIATDSRAMMKRMKAGCVGCGWCCSQTKRIVVDEEDAVRISRKLGKKRDDLFVQDEDKWLIKDVHPCGWWNKKNGRCQIYNDRPSTCRVWPLGINASGQYTVQPVPQCYFAVNVLVNKVIWTLSAAASGTPPIAPAEKTSS
jgi:hypothetical protein